MTRIDPIDQVAALSVLDYVSDLFTSSPRESFSRDEVLVILNAVRNDPEIFDAAVVALWDEETGEIV